MAPNALRLQTSYGSKYSTTPNIIWLQMLYDIIWLQMLYDSKHHMAPNALRLQTSYGSKCSMTSYGSKCSTTSYGSKRLISENVLIIKKDFNVAADGRVNQ
ncbi:hypothetical protein BgiBS90_029239 [Biomphalaria glabrata]|nr:hypothetical protein BgiBS90_029236 [Biomphalaria glabrata]KAI8767933.1 hypothetical protein BgiBS90_029239 [Biomphalaria glabrata]